MAIGEKITLEEASLEILEKVRERTEEEFAEKWKGKTDMVFSIALPVFVLTAFGTGEKLPEKYKTFEPVILEKYSDLIFETENLIRDATKVFVRSGLTERQAEAEAKVQIFQSIARKIPQGLAIEIIHLINS